MFRGYTLANEYNRHPRLRLGKRAKSAGVSKIGIYNFNVIGTMAYDIEMSGDLEISDAMIAAGVSVYKKWEPEYVHEALWPASDYAIRELVRSVYRQMCRTRDGE